MSRDGLGSSPGTSGISRPDLCNSTQIGQMSAGQTGHFNGTNGTRLRDGCGPKVEVPRQNYSCCCCCYCCFLFPKDKFYQVFLAMYPRCIQETAANKLPVIVKKFIYNRVVCVPRQEPVCCDFMINQLQNRNALTSTN